MILEHTPDMDDSTWSKVKEQNERTEKKLGEILGAKMGEEFMQFLDTRLERFMFRTLTLILSMSIKLFIVSYCWENKNSCS